MMLNHKRFFGIAGGVCILCGCYTTRDTSVAVGASEHVSAEASHRYVSLPQFNKQEVISAEASAAWRKDKDPDNAAPTAHIFGSTKSQVDIILSDWQLEKRDGAITDRGSRLSSGNRSVYYYTKDVSMATVFVSDRVVGVVVLDRPGAGVNGMSDSRFEELISLIGTRPAQSDITKDASGIHEFFIGDTEP